MKKSIVLWSIVFETIFSNWVFAETDCDKNIKRTLHGAQGQVVKFVTEKNESTVRWVCIDDKPVITSRKGSNGAYYSLSLGTRSTPFELIRKEKSETNRKTVSLLARIVLQERTGLDRDNRYWIIDLREQIPLVVGPVGKHDASDDYSALWGQKNVTIVLDEGKTNWKEGDRFFVEGESIKEKGGRLVPILTIDGKPSKKKEGFTAYHYDYSTKIVTEALLMVD